MRDLCDTVELDPGIEPERVRDAIVDAVNLEMPNDGRVSLPAHFIGWLVQEHDRMCRIDECPSCGRDLRDLIQPNGSTN